MSTNSTTAASRTRKYPVSSETVESILLDLLSRHGNFKTELTYESPFQLLIAVVLSAQCTDARVNLTTPALFARYPDAKRLAAAPQEAVEKLIHSCGFYRAKAKAIRGAAAAIAERFGGVVPQTMEELVSLPGVGRKTASVVMNQAFDLPAIAVDTHVARVAQRLAWATSTDAVKIEFELRELIPVKLWAAVNGLLIAHGRYVCKARAPLCESCELSDRCYFFKERIASGPQSLRKSRKPAPKKPGRARR